MRNERASLIGAVVVGGLAIHGLLASCGSVSHAPDAQIGDVMAADSAMADASVPAGTVVAFAGDTVPTGWVLCDGSTLSRTTYPGLFSAIGIAWGGGDGVTTFQVPDMRGRFLRGVSGTSGVDPDVAARATANPTGPNAAGSVQDSAIADHMHAYTSGPTTGGGYCAALTQNCAQPFPANTGTVRGAPSSTETRPSNVYVNYIIKL